MKILLAYDGGEPASSRSAPADLGSIHGMTAWSTPPS
jgi:hypothetical protein